MTRLFSFAALAVAAALVLAACGGSSTSNSSSSASTPSYGAAKPSTSNTSNSSGAASVSTKTSSLGTFLVDGSGRDDRDGDELPGHRGRLTGLLVMSELDCCAASSAAPCRRA